VENLMKKQGLAALIGAVALCGLTTCTHNPSVFAQEPVCDRHQRQFCRGNHCDIDVTVTSCSADGIKVAENELHLCRRDGRKTINWNLPPGGAFKFRDNGIDFKNLPDNEDFDPATKSKGPFKYSWDDKLRNGGGKSFEYAIRLEDASGRPCDKDPRIVND